MKFVVAAIAGAAVLTAANAHAGDRADYKRPLTIPFEGVTPYSPQLATLGKMLFFDPRLSGARNMSCASCHNPSFGFEAPVAGSVGAANVPLGRNTPTVINAAWVSPNFWDGRAKSLEEQAAGPIGADKEMNGDLHDIVGELKTIPDYKSWFDQVFPKEGVSEANVLTAIATYERTVVAEWSPFDRWVDGDETAISDSAKRGFDLFTGKANCSLCHTGWNFTDNEFHDIGLSTQDPGRALVDPKDPKAAHAFKTPGLRNTEYRAPFMHDGSIPDLEGVIAHYESGGIQRRSLSDFMLPIELSDNEREDLIAFLRTLTAERQDTPLPTLPN